MAGSGSKPHADREHLIMTTGTVPSLTNDQRYLADVHAPHDARRHVRARLGQWGLTGIADATELVSSELVTNAVNASMGGEIALQLAHTRWSVIVKVWDDSPEPPKPRDADLLAENGHGLELVEALTFRWGYYFADSGGKIVWAEILKEQAAP